MVNILNHSWNCTCSGLTISLNYLINRVIEQDICFFPIISIVLTTWPTQWLGFNSYTNLLIETI